MPAADTRERLVAGTLLALRELGVAGVSARTIAAKAEVNQALVFYHFGSVDNLLAEACRSGTAHVVAGYAERFGHVGSLRELLAVGREIRSEQRDDVAVLAQLLSVAHANPTVRDAIRDSLRLWTAQVTEVLDRVLGAGPLAGLFDPAALAHVVAAAFIGLELFENVDPAGTTDALAELDRLGTVAEALDGLGPVARRAVRAKLAPKRGAANRAANRP